MRAHIFVDCENIDTFVFKKAYSSLAAKYQIVKCDFYGKVYFRKEDEYDE